MVGREGHYLTNGMGVGAVVAITLLPNHRLGKRVLKASGEDLAPGPPIQVEQLELQLGQQTVACSAQVVGKFSLHRQPHFPSLLPFSAG